MCIFFSTQNVSLQDYLTFGEFLNRLEEFSISLKIYNVANQPVTQGTEFEIHKNVFS